MTLISQLDELYPKGASNFVYDGDDEIRQLKAVLKGTLPNITSQVTADSSELNLLTGKTSVLSSLQADSTPTLGGNLDLNGFVSDGALKVRRTSDTGYVTVDSDSGYDTHVVLSENAIPSLMIVNDASNNTAKIQKLSGDGNTVLGKIDFDEIGNINITHGVLRQDGISVSTTDHTHTESEITDLTTASNPNIAINGNFDIWQRGTSGTIQNSVGYYTADRWASRFYSAGSGNVSRNGSAPDQSRYSALVVRNSGQTATNVMQFFQVVESVDAMKLRGGDVTLSFWAKDAGGATNTTLVTRIQTGTGVDQGSVLAADNVWTGFVHDDQNNTLTGSWTKYTHTFALGGGVQEISVFFNYTPVGTAGSDDGYLITNVKLEAGSVATGYEHRSFSDELALCQRFYQKSYELETNPGTATYRGAACWRKAESAGNASIMPSSTKLAVEMRITPTIAIYDPGATNVGNTIRQNTSGTVTVSSVYKSSTSSPWVYINLATSPGGPYWYYTQWTADAEL